MKVLIIGDTHGDWGRLNTLIDRKKPDMAIICGDFGYWPSLVEEKITYGWGGSNTIYKKKENDCLSKIKTGKTKIFFIDGNHEDHNSLNKYQDGKINELKKNIFFCSRGSSLVLPDGRRILFIGGAKSIDKNMRTPGVDWFAEETISNSDFKKCMDYDRIDIVISHTCPEYFAPDLITGNMSKIYDPSCLALNEILNKYKPPRWFFGHFHLYINKIYNNCNWTCLNYLGHKINGKSWILI